MSGQACKYCREPMYVKYTEKAQGMIHAQAKCLCCGAAGPITRAYYPTHTEAKTAALKIWKYGLSFEGKE